MRDYYRILGIPDNADIYDIKSAYRRLAKLYHPDLNPGNRHSEEKFKEILDAYTILSDPDLRAQYDRKRNLGFRSEFRPSAKPGESEKEKKKDPGRKEYPPEYIERLRQRNRSRIVKQIQRRKKILRGMIITFALYLVGTAIFESWLARKNEKETAEMNRRIAEIHERDSLINVHDGIRNLDSPYDSIFGAGVSTWLSPNQLVVINPITDAVVCLVQNGPPHRTIRNEFIHAYQSFIMKEIPNGNYSVKVYIGDSWKDSLTVPDGRALGRFSMNEQFFRIDRDPIILTKPTYENPHTVTTDTIRIDPNRMKFVQISQDAFFDKGDNEVSN